MVESLLLGLASLFNLVLGLLIILRRKNQSPLSLFFAVSTISVASWGGSTIILNIYTTMFWERILFASAITAVVSIVLFSYEYRERLETFVIGLIATIWAMLVAFITFTELVVISVAKLPGGGIDVTRGPLINLFNIYVLVLLVILFRNLFAGYRTTEGLKHLQLKYLFLGVVMFVAPALMTNLILPNLGISALNNLGTIFSIFLTGSVTIGIVKHRLFSIRTVTLKILQTSILGFALFSLVLAQRWIKDSVLGLSPFAPQSLMLDFVTATMVAIFIQGFISWLEKTVGTLIHSEVITLQHLLDDLDTESNEILTYDEIVDKVIPILKSAFVDTEILFFKGDAEVKGFEGLKEVLIKQETSRDNNYYTELFNSKFDIVAPIYDDYFFTLSFINKREVLSKTELDTLSRVIDKLEDIFVRVVTHEKTVRFNEELQKKVDEATEELNEKILQLEEARRKERDMLDIMGHELRTPLSILKIKLGLMGKKLEKDAEFDVKEYYLKNQDTLKDAISREVELVETMLSSTKLDAGRMELTLDKVNVKKVVDDSIVSYENQANDKGLKIDIKPINEELDVYADKVRFSEIVDNFISNAVKYTEEGSVTIEVNDIDDMVEMKFIDTGVGIPDDAIPKLGQKFYRVNQYIEDGEEDGNIVRPGGTGLGLYVIFRLINMMKGEYKVESVLDEGTTFSFTMPKYIDQELSHVGNMKKDVFNRLGLNSSES